ncbi:hypothetical protein PAB09_09110 [Corynebacterium sp. SCR221107]|uniref:hypothetical protein n=1 Tax=Corynebacterium sp. SCR221107 TaxID=3017361 RepID=UPI0022EC17AE|nr:hypothetical protein [Corynebacterium sp. SCR221107]WBT08058.1 hypothetical protein PAB09_09110 [Corynebacterium sp. SCR221107]
MTLNVLSPAFATEPKPASSSNKYFYDSTVNTGLDTGFSETHQISKDDPHFGWSLGSFVVQGFTSRKDGEVPVFLKNVGDDVSLAYVLKQNIDALNGDSEVAIANDEKAYDEHFGIGETQFGRGTLIVKHVNYQNESTSPQIYKDYLVGVTVDADTKVEVLEEGDYEVALDYEIKSPSAIPFRPKLNNYQTFFRFKVRNSNSMVFLFDKESGAELYNGSATEHGFRIDLAGSRYLTVNVQKQILNPTGDGLVEDSRFNRSATDGSEFTEAGIYTITVRSDSNVEEPTTKRIYVGNDQILKASVVNSLDIQTVRERLEAGEIIDADGNLVSASREEQGNDPHTQQEDSTSSTSRNPQTTADEVREAPRMHWGVLAAGGVILTAVLILGMIALRRRLRPVVDSEQSAS